LYTPKTLQFQCKMENVF